MNVLIRIHNSPMQHFLVTLPDEKAVRSVKGHISRGRYSNAIMTAFAKSKSAVELDEKAAEYAQATLILTETSVHWDLTA